MGKRPGYGARQVSSGQHLRALALTKRRSQILAAAVTAPLLVGSVAALFDERIVLWLTVPLVLGYARWIGGRHGTDLVFAAVAATLLTAAYAAIPLIAYLAVLVAVAVIRARDSNPTAHLQ